MSVTRADYISIPISSLRADQMVGFDIYFKPSPDASPVLYRKAGLPFTEEARARLADGGTAEVHIFSDDREVYYAYLESNLPAVLSDDSVAVAAKTEVLYDCAQNAVQEILSDPEAADVLPRSEALVRAVTDFMFREEDFFECFLKTSSFDYHVYTHSVNVFVYSLTLAHRLGHTDPAFLRTLGTGGLLHDIGKSRVDSAVLHNTGKLDDTQWEMMRMHTVWGWEILKKQGVTDPVILQVTRSHHEKMGGTGYPDGLAGEDIPGIVRIVTVCDIFDALTTRRSYKDAQKTYDALDLMQREMRDELDPEIFDEFVKMMAVT